MTQKTKKLTMDGFKKKKKILRRGLRFKANKSKNRKQIK